MPVKRKKSNILDAAMTSEWKTDLAPHSRSPLERLGVNMMANAKNWEGTTKPIKDLYGGSKRFGLGGKLADFNTITKDIRYSAGHAPDKYFTKKGEALKGTVNKYTGDISRLKDQPNLPKWMERMAGQQMGSVVHEGVHKAMDSYVRYANRPSSGKLDHRIIQTMGLEKIDDPGYIKAVPAEAASMIRRHNINRKNRRMIYVDRRSKSGLAEYNRIMEDDKNVTAKANAWASGELKRRGEEDPSTFVDHSKELTKSVKKINKLQNIEETIMRNSLAKPIVTARKINWGT